MYVKTANYIYAEGFPPESLLTRWQVENFEHKN